MKSIINEYRKKCGKTTRLARDVQCDVCGSVTYGVAATQTVRVLDQSCQQCINTHRRKFAEEHRSKSGNFPIRQKIRKMLRPADSPKTVTATHELPPALRGTDPHQFPGCRTPLASSRDGVHAPPSNSCVPAHRQQWLPAPGPASPGSPPAADRAWATQKFGKLEKVAPVCRPLA